jgi:hypothetical protein
MPFQPDSLPYCQLRWSFVVFSLLQIVKVLLEFYSCFLEGLEPFLGGGDMVRYQVDVNRGCHACEKFVGGLFEGVMFSQVVHVFCYWQKLCPASGV